MKIYIMTDLECVAGVINLSDYCLPNAVNKYGIDNVGQYYDHARYLATMEVNAAIEGLLEGGASDILVCDGHGHGGLDIAQIHPAARVMAGVGQKAPRGLDSSFHAAIMIGQHAKANTDGGHLCHSQSFFRNEELLNGEPHGEIACFMAMCSHYDVPVVMLSGDAAAAREATLLAPSIKTAVVIEGQKLGSTYGMTAVDAINLNVPAIHVSPTRARQLIHETSVACLNHIDKIERFKLEPPYEYTRINRPDPQGLVMRSVNASSDLVDLFCQKPTYEPVKLQHT